MDNVTMGAFFLGRVMSLQISKLSLQATPSDCVGTTTTITDISFSKCAQTEDTKFLKRQIDPDKYCNLGILHSPLAAELFNTIIESLVRSRS